MSGELAATTLFRRMVQHFPARHLRMVFAYGSGVFQQEGHQDVSKNMVDFVFVVDEPGDWHEQNLIRNSDHYSFLRHFGARRIASVQENFGAGIYFNTLVPCEGRLMKYGVISTKCLLDDLLDWNTLYVGGRLHKPVNTVHFERDPALSAAQLTNLQSAVHTALLTLSDSFSEQDLFTAICGLSYSGDFRMKVGEDKNKISNIVKPNMERFRAMYENILDTDPHLYWNKTQGEFEQSLSVASRSHHLNLLPKMLQINVVAHRNKDGRQRDTEEVLHDLAHDIDCSDIIHECVAKIVHKSSISQSLKGLLTAGVVKSAQYSYSKLQKMWKSKQKIPEPGK